jgi:hypothetical protein
MSVIPNPPDPHDVMRRDDPEHVALIQTVADVRTDVRTLKVIATELKESHQVTQQLLLGKWDQTAGKTGEWRPGVLQELQSLREAAENNAVAAREAAAASAQASLDSSKRLVDAFRWAIAAATTILTSVGATMIITQYNQHIDTLHAVARHAQ